MPSPCDGCWKESSHVDCDSCLPYREGCRFAWEPYSQEHPKTEPIQYPSKILKIPKRKGR